MLSKSDLHFPLNILFFIIFNRLVRLLSRVGRVLFFLSPLDGFMPLISPRPIVLQKVNVLNQKFLSYEIESGKVAIKNEFFYSVSLLIPEMGHLNNRLSGSLFGLRPKRWDSRDERY